MCEFCSIGPSSPRDRDSSDARFAGFFNADAIEAAVRQAAANKTADAIKNKRGRTDKESNNQKTDEDDDGT